MTIEEGKALKAELEAQMLEAIKLFEQRSGLRVGNLQHTSHDMSLQGATRRVRMEVLLP